MKKTIHLAGPPTKSATKRRLKDLFFYFSSKLFSTSNPPRIFLEVIDDQWNNEHDHCDKAATNNASLQCRCT